MLVLENIDTKYGRTVLTAKSRSILTILRTELKVTKLNSQTKMAKSISRKVTISNFECTQKRRFVETPVIFSANDF